jgi:hypothetical protein
LLDKGYWCSVGRSAWTSKGKRLCSAQEAIDAVALDGELWVDGIDCWGCGLSGPRHLSDWVDARESAGVRGARRNDCVSRGSRFRKQPTSTTTPARGREGGRAG